MLALLVIIRPPSYQYHTSVNRAFKYSVYTAQF